MAARVVRPLMVVRLLGRAVMAWWGDGGMRMGASIAYYTLFAIAPILLIVIAVAGMVFGEEAARGEVVAQIDQLVGREGAEAVQTMLQGAARNTRSGFAAGIGFVTLFLAACGAFLELQASFNSVWRVKAVPQSKVKEFVLDRVRSFGLVVSFGFLLLVSLAVSAALAGLGQWLRTIADPLPVILVIVNWLVSFAVTAALFGLLFKFLPDVKLAWPDVIAGALITALLFNVGKHFIGLYLGRSAVTSTYGAAGSIVLLLLWVYYSSQIVLLGAEFTRLYAAHRAGPPPAQSFAIGVSDAQSPGR